MLKQMPSRVGHFLERKSSILVGGEWIEGFGPRFPVEDPSTAGPLVDAVEASPEDVDAAVSSAAESQPRWRSRDYYGRYLVLNELADLVEEHAEELAFLDSVDSGNPLEAMRHDVSIGVKQVRFMAGLGLAVRGETLPADNQQNLHFTFPEPYGVVGRIIPFNHPAMFALTKIAAPLVSGNTVVLKPAEQTPLSALYLGDLFRQVLPPGVVNIVTGGARTGHALVTHKGVKRIAFTGSVPTGQRIQSDAAATGIKHVTLELGGKNPMVVFPDADLERAGAAAVVGMNLTVCQGQSCGSNSRIFVHEDLYDQYVGLVIEKLRSLRVGIAYDSQTDVGPVVSEAQYERVLNYINMGRRNGGRVAFGGRALRDENGSNGYFIEPTLFEGLEVSDQTAREEIFGPVLSVFPWRDVDQVIKDANSVSFGLTASVWTRDVSRAHAVANRIEAGYVWINEHGPHYVGTPFGGYKNSGVGKEEAFDEILSYLQTKAVHLVVDDLAGEPRGERP